MNVSILIHFLGAQRLQRRFTNKRSKYVTTNQDTMYTKIPGTGACFIAGGWPMKPLMSYGPQHSVTPHGVPSFCCLPLSGPSSAGELARRPAQPVRWGQHHCHHAPPIRRCAFPKLEWTVPQWTPRGQGSPIMTRPKAAGQTPISWKPNPLIAYSCLFFLTLFSSHDLF